MKPKSYAKRFPQFVEDLGAIAGTLFNSPLRLSPARNQRFQQALASIDRFVYQLIQDRRQLTEKPRDLLSLLLTTRDAQTGEGLSDVQLRDEVVTMLIAGHETTGISIAWVWHLLAQNPHVESRLHAEVDGVLGGRVPSIDDVANLPYTKMVLEETMRLYPPVWFMMRQALQDDEIAGCAIPAKAFVLVSPYTTHRHPDYWPDPEQFDPDRFSAQNGKGRPPYAHFPFAGGRHLCLGVRFAMIEGQLILATLAQHFRLRAVSDHPAEPVLTLRQKDGLPMTLEPRR